MENKLKKEICLGVAILGAILFSHSATYYVATTGDNNHTKAQASNEATPWKTIQKAANEVTAGDVVIIAGGTYNEYITLPVSCNGAPNNLITFKSKMGETAIINGVGGWVWIGLIDTERSSTDKGNSYLKFEGLKLQNSYFFGFKLLNSNNIYIENCHTYKTGGSGIYFNGCSYVYVRNNRIEEACLNTSTSTNSQECISLAGTNNFEVSGNEVFNAGGASGGEGIDAKGNSHTGVISGNYVHDLDRHRGGIYVDSWNGEARNILIFGNKVEKCHHGIMISGEMGGYTHHIYIYNNILANNYENGFLQHQYGKGHFSEIYVENNTFYRNGQAVNTDAGDIWFQNTSTTNEKLYCRNNICSNSGTEYNFNIRIAQQDRTEVKNNISFGYKSAYDVTLGTDYLTTDPLFVNPDVGNFQLLASSSAINAGTSNVNTYLVKDYKGISRPQGNAFDIGAYEFDGTVYTGLNGIQSDKNLFFIYPNPARKAAKVSVMSGIRPVQVALFDMQGKKMAVSCISQGNEIEIDLREIGPGLYIIQATVGKHQSSKPIIIQ